MIDPEYADDFSRPAEYGPHSWPRVWIAVALVTAGVVYWFAVRWFA